MRQDAEQDGPQFASEDDPRITRVGRFLRRIRLDELPQLINVFRGEMAIVGPRPERPVFVNQFESLSPYFTLRNSVRPGITGWAQVMYGYASGSDEALEKLSYDLYYIKHFSLRQDLEILLRTVSVVLWGKAITAAATRPAVILTINVRDYFQASAFAGTVRPQDWDWYPSRYEETVAQLLDLFAADNARATFFVLGWHARHRPAVVRRIAEAGHEVACSGTIGRPLVDLTVAGFTGGVAAARDAIEDAAGVPVTGRRAPAYALHPRSTWSSRRSSRSASPTTRAWHRAARVVRRRTSPRRSGSGTCGRCRRPASTGSGAVPARHRQPPAPALPLLPPVAGRDRR